MGGGGMISEKNTGEGGGRGGKQKQPGLMSLLSFYFLFFSTKTKKKNSPLFSPVCRYALFLIPLLRQKNCITSFVSYVDGKIQLCFVFSSFWCSGSRY